MRYSLHITNNCNLRCTYCYEDDKLEKQHRPFLISFEEIDQKLGAILKRGDCDELELLGGEIFLYPDLLEYIFAKYGQNFKFFLTTNGMIRNKCIDNLIQTYRPALGVSLDDPQTIERQRVGIDFARVLENAQHWSKYDVFLIIDAVLTPLNIRRIKETFDFYILEQKFENIHFGCVEEWMNDYYWQVYKREAERLIQTTDLDVLRRVWLSPWKLYVPVKKEFVYEDGIEKVEIFNFHKVSASEYLKAQYYAHSVYCQRLGIAPAEMLPKDVELVPESRLDVVL
jgi:uncharacterized protein